VLASVKLVGVDGRAGTAVSHGANAAGIAAVLKQLSAAGDGAAGPEALLFELKSVIPFDRAVLLSLQEGRLQCIAAEPALDRDFSCEGIALQDLLHIRSIPCGQSKQPLGLGEFASLEESALVLPTGLAGRTAVAILTRADGASSFNDHDLTCARLCAAASLASIVAGKRTLAAETTAEQAVNDRLLKVILDHLPISLTVQDRDGKFVLVNAIAAADLAVSAEKLLGSSPADYLSPREAIARREWEESVIAGGKTITAETRVADHEGVRILLTSHTPVFITNNTLLISSSVDITEHKEVERRLTERAHIDKLTGLPDRVRIEQHVEAIIEGDEQRPFALAFIDLDNFKHVNDYYSHAIGDALLIKISERIKAKIKARDMLARISGDEFLLFLDGYENEAAVTAVIEEVLSEVKRPFHLEGFEIFSSCSIGVSFYPVHGRNYETLRRNADGAMYGAKARTKGQAMYFDDGLGKQIAARMEAEQRLRLAIRDKRFVCAFQPKVDIHTQDVVGFETLVRWRDSDGEIHPPGQFISLAIELGLINPITNFVLSETIASLDKLDAAFGEGKSVSINVGAKQTGDLAFMRGLVDTIRQSGAAERLILELTEDAIVEKGVFQSEILPSLREIGVRISIDDFGTGYSSLSALADITADEIKIDRSFISRIHERPRSQSVLKAIESLARSLGMSMVAEGVETTEELIYLQTASRIRFAQGFYFSKPVYLDEIHAGATFGGRTQDARSSSPEKTSGRLMAPARAR
jgi:cyclic di-GMP phosphodiesterase Gmr